MLFKQTALLAIVASPLGGVNALCQKAIGARVMTDDRCSVVSCFPSGACSYIPCHYIWVYHANGQSTGGFKIGGAATFAAGKQDQVYEWAFNGQGDGGGFNVYANGCGGNLGNGGLGGYGCIKSAVRRTNRNPPNVSRVYYDCGNTPAVPA